MPSDRPTRESQALFAYEASKDGMCLVRLFGFQTDGTGIRAAAETRSVHAPEESKSKWQFYDLPNREQAERFVGEALVALEYLGCIITKVER